jgi:hypothetical protein
LLYVLQVPKLFVAADPLQTKRARQLF